MQELSRFPYIEAEFDRDGHLNPPGQGAALIDAVGSTGMTDLIVIAHGWNNDMADARALYAAMFKNVRAILPQVPLPDGRRLGIIGILWPSKKFTDRELIPGGGSASVGEDSDEIGDVSTAHLEKEIDRLKAVATASAPDLDQAKTLIDELENDPGARKRFVDLVRASLDPSIPHRSPGAPAPEASREALNIDPEELFQNLRAPLVERSGESELGGAAGLESTSPVAAAASIGSIFSTAKAAAERLLNFATYYQMKERAGRVGASGVADLLRAIRKSDPHLRIHLVGHSFGARLVTAAADACGGEVHPSSMLLLQAAFSHNGFSPKFKADAQSYTGFFRRVVENRKVIGPIVVTHTANDRAIGIAYAVASRLARQAVSGLGDQDDLYGGLGRNGAVRMPDAELGGHSLELLAPSGNYGFAAGKVFNLKSDRFIDGHSGISNEAVAYAMLRTIA
jgi:hypothetical protein